MKYFVLFLILLLPSVLSAHPGHVQELIAHPSLHGEYIWLVVVAIAVLGWVSRKR